MSAPETAALSVFWTQRPAQRLTPYVDLRADGSLEGVPVPAGVGSSAPASRLLFLCMRPERAKLCVPTTCQASCQVSCQVSLDVGRKREMEPVRFGK